MCSNFVKIHKNVYQLLLKDTIAPYYELNLLKRHKRNQPVSDEAYLEELDGLITAHVDTAADWTENTPRSSLKNHENLVILGYMFKQILQNKTPQVEQHIKNTYHTRKEIASEKLYVPVYSSRADKAALYVAQTYNYHQIQDISNTVKQGVRSTITSGLLQGDSNVEIASKIRELPLTPLPAGGRMLTVDDRALMIARTETSRAMNQGSIITYQQHGITMVERVSAGDELVCAYCQEAESGSPYTLDNIPDDAEIPSHPGCRCTFNPVVESMNASPEDVDSFYNLYSGGESDVDSILN